MIKSKKSQLLLIAMTVFVTSVFVVLSQFSGAVNDPAGVTFVAELNDREKDRSDKASLPEPEPRTEEEFEGDAEEREAWFYSQRKYPFDKIPDDARRRAWQSRPEDAFPADAPNALNWAQIGPMPITSGFPSNWGVTSGRINSIAVSPSNSNIILVGAATGGIWRSADGGTTFVPVTDSQVDLAVGSIDFAPSNPTIVYAGMGDKDLNYTGSGVLRSTDSGVTWTRVSNSSLPTPGQTSQITVDPLDPNRVYLAQYAGGGFSSGVWLSTDGGVNWTRKLIGLAKDLVRHPIATGTLYATFSRYDGGGASTGGVWKSTDSGATWNRIYTSPYASTSNIKIAVTPAASVNLYVLVGDGSTARVETSTNEGSTWTNHGGPFDVAQFYYDCYLFVNPTNVNTIYVGTRDLWRSTDGGTTYTNLTNNFDPDNTYHPTVSRSHPDQHHFYQSPTSPNTIYLANDGGLSRSTDGGATFSSLNSGLDLTMYVSYAMHPTNTALSYGGTQDNGTVKRTGTLSWKEFIPGDGGQVIVDPLDNTIVYTTYVYNTIYRFGNNGDTFQATIGSNTVFNNDRVQFYPPFVGTSGNSNLYFGTYRLYRSTDRGNTWTAPGGATDLTNGGTLTAIGVASSDNNFIYTGASDGRVMVSTNAGVNWTDRTAGLPTRFIKSIIVSPSNPSTAYLTVSGFNSGHVFKTTNAGATWTDISGNLPNIPTNTLLIDPRAGQSSTLYVGTDVGIYRSTVDGTTWQTFNTGLPPVIVSEIDARPGGLMQAGTYGRGAYEIDLNQGNTPTNTPTFTPTPTATNTATFTPTSAATPSIGGTVTYGNAAAPPKYISNVTVNGAGSPNVFATTAAPGATAGQYILTGFGAGSYTVSLSKTTGQNSVTSNDAALIAAHVAGTATITSTNKKIAADTSGNGSISSQDAAFIARFAAGLGAPIGNTNQWRFYVPNPTFPIGASPTTRTYPSATGNITGEDYIGLLIGEVSGNWTPSAARSVGSGQEAEESAEMDTHVQAGPERNIAVELPNVSIDVGKEIVVPVNVQEVAGKGVVSYEFDLKYDPTVMQPLYNSVEVAGTVSRGLSVVTNASEPGLLRVVLYGAFPIDQDGVLMNLRFTAIGEAGSVSPITFERIMFNEGEPRVTVADGKVELF